MSSITNPRKYTIAFKFLETDTIQHNQITAGNNLFKPIRQKYGDRLEECEVDEWRLFITISQCLHADGEQLYQELLMVLEATELFHHDGIFAEPQLFEWAVFEETEEGLKQSSNHRSATLDLFHTYKRRIFL
ncbi:hypothetical protein NW761_008690 [Fusarium oxysporum]|nr:hypothetical protein NW758_004011 [Fusarium oxysporum]WKT52915.1 hypothetical protein QSH57_003477 [Fusarium oxysporum f. sp. vasinfectum]KAJ4055909.1 hypothetical protein NW753_006679 [Fusarium oxysporum]KAJ4061507.1 hypothetical protein NW763_004890 [Fusarium oxysporum]KAJ4085582.1 hypothetical protein NW761_008690 [Fusarium oxysporum]